jgi:hypothetical protein
MPDVGRSRSDVRLRLLGEQNHGFAKAHAGAPTSGIRSAYDRAVRLMRSPARAAFDLDAEPTRVRDAYGRNLFGQGCLLARRLVERGVPFVEVHLGRVRGAFAGWDTHAGNFEALKALCGTLDPAWAALMSDLERRGLLATTTVIWLGEFGRTPRINGGKGRDHFPNAWSAVVGGGGVAGGQAVGRTSKDGMTVEALPVGVPDLQATVFTLLGIAPTKQNMSNIGRPIPVVERGGKPVKEVLA